MIALEHADDAALAPIKFSLFSFSVGRLVIDAAFVADFFNHVLSFRSRSALEAGHDRALCPVPSPRSAVRREIDQRQATFLSISDFADDDLNWPATILARVRLCWLAPTPI
jgi:hypothetical protein